MLPLRHLTAATLLAAGLAATSRLAAQPAGLPRLEPLSPAVAARSGLFVPPFVPRTAGAWRVGAEIAYGSVVERNLNWPDTYLLDAELARVTLRARRDVGGRGFVELQGGAQGAFAGVADRLFERYHDVIAWVMEERDARPRNVYGDRLYLDALDVNRLRAARGPVPSDVRLTAGLEHDAAAQTLLSMTAPVAPATHVMGRGAPTVSLLHARYWAVGARTTVQGSAGLGWTPRHGELAPVQRTLHAMWSAGARVRVRGPHALYASVFRHSAPHRRSGFPELDRSELSADFGYARRAANGREWRIGLTEDTRRRDPGIDLVLRISVE